jgi:hypothetical protein
MRAGVSNINLFPQTNGTRRELRPIFSTFIVRLRVVPEQQLLKSQALFSMLAFDVRF